MATTGSASAARFIPVTTTAVFREIVLSPLCGAGHRENPDAAMSQTHSLLERRVFHATQ
jgi:hypothetical protein